jgi:quercetin dioxygenase-like cupin family protein
VNELEVPMREMVNALQRESAKFPQLELHTDHYFADGMYARVIARPKDAVIVGKVHKREHFYIVTKGKVRVTTDDGVKDIEAPTVIVSKPGTKRAVWALEDSVCMTVHRTDSTDLDEIEAELIEPDELALFDSSNHLRALT